MGYGDDDEMGKLMIIMINGSTKHAQQCQQEWRRPTTTPTRTAQSTTKARELASTGEAHFPRLLRRQAQ
ncbi:hypothetical protein L484_025448 [Morus notabilis]|uniref:Uncharacterized protein n=1 Tax=Morus notabilis TaxID=981085 RepID=W9RNX5_9ROSA|nr:hypothetical protein L484_025448 [Morus notabilis]